MKSGGVRARLSFMGKVPTVFASPYDEHAPSRMHVKAPRYAVMPVDEPIVVRVGAVAAWWDGETLKIAHAGRF